MAHVSKLRVPVVYAMKNPMLAANVSTSLHAVSMTRILDTLLLIFRMNLMYKSEAVFVNKHVGNNIDFATVNGQGFSKFSEVLLVMTYALVSTSPLDELIGLSSLPVNKSGCQATDTIEKLLVLSFEKPTL